MKPQPEIQVRKKHYLNLAYDSKNRWISYWYQINEIIKSEPKTILEIGVGNKTVSDYLKKLGYKVTTLDFDKALKPDIVGDIRSYDFKNRTFDAVFAAEVLEHLPFKDFKKALKQIKKVVKKKVIISLPHFSITDMYFGIKIIPYISKKEFSLKVDIPIKHKFLGEHYWEIGKKNYKLARICNEIKSAGFKIDKEYYPKENPRHHFFILSR